MDSAIRFDPELLRNYDVAGPRYTSYPTAVQFHENFNEADYRRHAMASNIDGRPLSLYVHVPFCNTVCFYCACSKIITANRSRVLPYLNRLHSEIALQGSLFDRGRPVRQLHWGGGTPTYINAEQMQSLMGVIGEHFTLVDDDSGEYSIEIDPREVHIDGIALLRELGFNRLSIGVQDFDPRVQQAVNRIQPTAVTEAAVLAARGNGFKSISMDLIYGLPLQTVASFDRTLDTVIAMSPDRLSVFNYAHLPHMFKMQRQINPEELPSAAVKLQILQHVIHRLSSAGYVYIGMDHFAKPGDQLAQAQRQGTLHRNFQGYSTNASCDMIGLGMTAIGRVGNSYSQNAKTLDAYYADLDNFKIPIQRGLVLNEDDRLRREVITQIVCHDRLNIGAIEQRFDVCFQRYFATELLRLAPMQEDGLLALRPDSIEVLPAGRLLIRNIAMVFDRYLAGDDGQRFSKAI